MFPLGAIAPPRTRARHHAHTLRRPRGLPSSLYMAIEPPLPHSEPWNVLSRSMERLFFSTHMRNLATWTGVRIWRNWLVMDCDALMCDEIF